MITFQKLGTHGRLGNQLFQIAFMLGLKTKHNLDMLLPAWEYADYFENPVTSNIPAEQIKYDARLAEAHFHYTPEFWDQYADQFRSKTYDILCWGQSEKYFEHCSELIRQHFRFKRDFKDRVLSMVPSSLWDRPVISISVRQGDYVDNPNYELLTAKYYILALLENFPDFRERYNLLFLSDDMEYCKLHFSCLPNAFFADGLNGIEQLCLGSMGAHAIISNSTFSWWMAWILESTPIAWLDDDKNPNPIIVRPNFLFAGPLLKTSDSRDFYPSRWINVDHKIKKIDLKNTTFTIPLLFDSEDRRQNVNLTMRYLTEDFDTNFIIGEQGRPHFEYLSVYGIYYHFKDMDTFHRTKMLNDMAGMCRTPVVANWDCDVIVPPMQIVEAVHSITASNQDMVYPYDGRFARVPRSSYKVIERRKDIGCMRGAMFNGMRPNDALSVGGAIFWNVNSFIRGGLENENMISYGPEDAERYDRFKKLGFNVSRIPGVLYHIDHVQSLHSSVKHPHFPANVRELEKIRSMSVEQLRSYIDTWPWATVYTPSYYESIFEESVKSRDEIFSALEDRFRGHWSLKTSSLIDVGCAVGSWGHEMESKFGIEYTGIDFGVPVEKLVISRDQYIDHDLRLPFKSEKKYDIVLCLEVAEHLPKESAETLVETLCGFGGVILFSAAIPGQGGVQHINEQWQNWWRDLFIKRGYYPVPFDFRDQIWNNQDIGLWYRQNLVIYGPEEIEGNPEMDVPDLNRVHPDMYMNVLRHYQILK